MQTSTTLPVWVPRLIATLLIAVLTLALISLAIAMPALSRLADSRDSIPTAASVVDEAPQTLEQVKRIDGNVAKVTPTALEALGEIPLITPQLTDLLAQADQLHNDVEGLRSSVKPLNQNASELVKVADQVTELRGTLQELQELSGPLEQLATSAGPLPEQLRQLNESAATLATLASLITPLIDSIQSMEKHVANLDQKTGPVLLPDFGQ